MAEQHGSRKLTRADVVIGVVTCLLFIVLVPVLFARPREASVRRLCAANLAQIGKAMLVYATDYQGALPRAGGPSTVWMGMPNFTAWKATDRRMAFNIAADGTGGQASISSSFYLLVKYCQLPPRVFVCKGDHGTTEFKMSGRTDVVPNFELRDAWDFGPPLDAVKHCSYAYHVPFSMYALTTSRDPNFAVASDRNPWIRSPAAEAGVWSQFHPDFPPYTEVMKGGPHAYALSARKGNSIAHELDGQNVLFLDGRVTFETRAYCGLDMDNIYTPSRDPQTGDVLGSGPPPLGPTCMPANRRDSVLVHDPDVFASTTKKR